MVNQKAAVTMIVGLFVASIMAAFLLPVAIGPMTDGETATVVLDTSETYEAQPGLNVTLDSVTNDTSATYTVTAGGDTANPTVNQGANTTVTVDGADVTIAADDVTSTNATTTITSPTSYGWGSGAAAMWAILPVLVVLAVFLYFVGMATGYI